MKQSEIVHPDDLEAQVKQSSLFELPGITRYSYNPYPPIHNSVEEFQRLLDDPRPEKGIDFEFDSNFRPTVVGLSTPEETCGIKWSDKLGQMLIDAVKERPDLDLVAYSTFSADKPVLDKASGITSIDNWSDGMVTHHLCHADFCKVVSGKEEDDPGALGFMNLWTATSITSDVPQWKVCLTGDSKIQDEFGKFHKIKSVVENKKYFRIKSIDPYTGEIIKENINNWYAIPRGKKKIYKLEYEGFRYNNKKGYTYLTEDHKVLTNLGWKEVKDLSSKDLIATGTPGISRKHQAALAGIILGDGHIDNKGRLHLGHSKKQLEYLRLKQKLFDNLSFGKDVIRPAQGNTDEFIAIKSKCCPALQKLICKKDWIIKSFNKFSLLIWYLDDGYLSSNNIAEISCISLENTIKQKLVNKINSMGCACKINKKGRIIFTAEGTKKLALLLGKYVPKTLKYKIPVNYQYEYPQTALFSPSYITHYAPAVVTEVNKSDEIVYCIDVNYSRNFITSGGVVHNCRGKVCEGPCPRHKVLDYCLRGDQTVFLANGKKERISKLVRNKYKGQVLCINNKGEIVTRSVKNWFSNSRNNRKFIKISYKYALGNNCNTKRSVTVTEDHKFLTINGYIAAKDLTKDDLIATGTPAMSARQLGALAGILLGDSHLRKKDLCLAHLEKQEEYLKYKTKLFSNFKHTFGTSKTNNGLLSTVLFLAAPFWDFLNSYIKNDFISFAYNNLNEIGLAFWYLDDGCLCKGKRGKGVACISVSRFSISEVKKLQKLLFKKFGLETNLYDYSPKTIRFNAENTEKLCQIIYKYTPTCMQYKLRKNYQNKKYKILFTDNNVLWSEPIIMTATPRIVNGIENKDNTVYCIEVEEFNNFITEGGTVHNCAMDAWGGLHSHLVNWKEAQKHGVTKEFYRELMELEQCCYEMEQRGVHIDMAYVEETNKDIQKAKFNLFPLQKGIAGNPLEGSWEWFNPQAPLQGVKWFKEQGIHLDSGQKPDVKKAVEKIAKRYGFKKVEELEESDTELEFNEDVLLKWYQFKSTGKGLKTWFEYGKKVDRKTNLAHPRITTTGTSTGRLSSPYHNIPAHAWGELVRTAVTPREKGWRLLKTDFSNLELRMVTYLAGMDTRELGPDAFMWLVNKAPQDFEKAAKWVGWSERQVAKSVSHASDYLEGLKLFEYYELEENATKRQIQEGALKVYLKKFDDRLKKDWTFRGKVVCFTGSNLADRMFGNHSAANRKKALTIQEDVYFKNFWFLREWHMRLFEEIEDSGFVKSPTGRFLRLYNRDEDDCKIAAAYKGQGVSADFVQEKMIGYWREKVPILLQVHDELDFEIPPEDQFSDAKVNEMLEIMRAESKRLPGFICPAKGLVGDNWNEATMRKVEYKG